MIKRVKTTKIGDVFGSDNFGHGEEMYANSLILHLKWLGWPLRDRQWS